MTKNVITILLALVCLALWLYCPAKYAIIGNTIQFLWVLKLMRNG